MEPTAVPHDGFRVSVPAGKPTPPQRVLLSLDGKTPFRCGFCQSMEWDITLDGETVTFTCDHDRENRHD